MRCQSESEAIITHQGSPASRALVARHHGTFKSHSHVLSHLTPWLLIAAGTSLHSGMQWACAARHVSGLVQRGWSTRYQDHGAAVTQRIQLDSYVHSLHTQLRARRLPCPPTSVWTAAAWVAARPCDYLIGQRRDGRSVEGSVLGVRTHKRCGSALLSFLVCSPATSLTPHVYPYSIADVSTC